MAKSGEKLENLAENLGAPSEHFDKFLARAHLVGHRHSASYCSSEPLFLARASIYLKSLTELYNQIDELVLGIKKEKIEKKGKKLQMHGDIIYPNDILYESRVILGERERANQTLVDYLSAAIVASDKNLKSVNYALRKYVIPIKDKFREHPEDAYFAQRRRNIHLGEIFYGVEAADALSIQLSPDPKGIKDHKEFLRYFNYVRAAIIAYLMGVKPDWIINTYMTPFGIETKKENIKKKIMGKRNLDTISFSRASRKFNIEK
jgi:hypothetical protein